MNWIPVSDQLPKPGEIVLGFWPDDHGAHLVDAIMYETDDACFAEWIEPAQGDLWEGPTHWMPLPDPPEDA